MKRIGIMLFGGLLLFFLLLVKVSFPPPEADCIFVDNKFYRKIPQKTAFVPLPAQGSLIELHTCERTGMHRAEIQRGIARYLLVIR